MALMIPDDVPRGEATEGELLVFRYLKQLLPDDFRVYFEPEIRAEGQRKSSQPDFVVFGPEFGLLVLEVKDWVLSQIEYADTNSVTIRYSRDDAQAQSNTSPLRKVRDYCYQVLDKFKKHSLLVEQRGPHQGQVCFPFGWAVVFTNIQRAEFERYDELNTLFSGEFTLCRDELSQLWQERDDRSTIRRLQKFLCRFPFDPLTDEQIQKVEYVLNSRWTISGMLDRLRGNERGRKKTKTSPVEQTPSPPAKVEMPRFDDVPHQPLTNDQVQTIQGVLHPESVLRDRPATKASVPAGWSLPADARVLEVLTVEQERQARAIGPGHRIFFGVAGSGKTVLLLARAKWLASSRPQTRVLVLCYNNTLVSFLREHLGGHPNVAVETFVTWAMQRYYLPPDKSTWSEPVITQAVGEQTPVVADRYDAILIDEGHDFQPVWFRAVVDALSHRETSDLMVAVDGSQSIYGRPKRFTWKSVGINAQGRSRPLANNYRNTKQIFEFAWKLTQPPIDPDEGPDTNGTHLRISPAQLQRNGSLPLRLDCSQLGGAVEGIVAALVRWKRMGLRDSDIAIVTRTQRATAKILSEVRRRLKSYGYETTFAIAKSQSNKRSIIQKRAVSVLSYASSKGLEFPAVLVTGIEHFQNDPTKAKHLNELYVALTRAQHELVVSWNKPCWLATALNGAEFTSLTQSFPLDA